VRPSLPSLPLFGFININSGGSFKAKKKKIFDRPDFRLDVCVYKLFFKWYAENVRGYRFGPYPALSIMLHNIRLFKTALNLSREKSRDIQRECI
jgi:hypothetical protein